MVGVKGYDATALEALRRHNVWIVSKTSNANTITHYVKASLKTARRVIADIEAVYPQAEVGARQVALVAVIGRDLSGQRVLCRGLQALHEADIDVIAAQQGPRNVEVQFALPREAGDKAVRCLHDALVTQGRTGELAAVA